MGGQGSPERGGVDEETADQKSPPWWIGWRRRSGGTLRATAQRARGREIRDWSGCEWTPGEYKRVKGLIRGCPDADPVFWNGGFQMFCIVYTLEGPVVHFWVGLCSEGVLGCMWSEKSLPWFGCPSPSLPPPTKKLRASQSAPESLGIWEHLHSLLGRVI